MKYLVAVLALINGAWMLIDDIHVIVNGKYIGPEKPGPWVSLIGVTGVDVYELGPVFIVFGLAWLAFVGAFLAEQARARNFGIVISLLTLWYLPFGTLISLVVLAAILFMGRGIK